MWRTLHALEGKTHTPISGETIVHNDNLLVTAKQKANGFIKQFSEVSRIRCSREERERAKTYVDEAMAPCQSIHNGEDPCKPFAEHEIDDALRKMRRNKAAGPDLISNEMLRELPRSAKLILLQILNQSWTEKSVPGVWRGATIIPILKRGKPADKLSSYRPISLTSNVSKLMERLVKERLQTWLEQNGKLNKMQSGFRAQHATTDHVMRMTQMIADNFQVRKRTVLTLIDYAKAFDSVWRPVLYHKMAEMEIPACYINLDKTVPVRNRSARVCVNGTTGRAGKLKAGVFQGGVLSPLLFLIYINNALEDAPNDVH